MVEAWNKLSEPCKTSKEQLGEQLKRLKLDDDLRYMVNEGLRKMTDTEALILAGQLRILADSIVVVIQEVIKNKGTVY